MATPPFNINEAKPADTDIVSQFPADERANRDIIEDWISTEHGTSGHHTIPAGNTAARNAITDWEVGSIFFNTDTTPAGFQRVVSVGPVVWESIAAQATETAAGVLEIATEAEVETGTDHTRAVTPDTLRDADLTRGGVTIFNNAIREGAWTNLASAATTDLGSVASTNIQITGTETITSFGTAPEGTRKRLRFTGAATITFGSAILANGRNTGTYFFDGNGEEIIEAVSRGSGNWLLGFQFVASAGVNTMIAATDTNYAVTAARLIYGPTIPKAMAAFDGELTGTNDATAGFNKGTITRQSEGRYRWTFGVTMADTNYLVNGFGKSTDTIREAIVAENSSGSAEKTTTYVDIMTGTAANAAVDVVTGYLFLYGTLA